MPYIKQQARDEILSHPERKIANAGELNFALTLIIEEYLKSNGRNYQHFNDCMGALEGCKLELYRRMIAPYEDEKLQYNGDVYHGKGHTFLRT